jgi:hypothetical protein
MIGGIVAGGPARKEKGLLYSMGNVRIDFLFSGLFTCCLSASLSFFSFVSLVGSGGWLCCAFLHPVGLCFFTRPPSSTITTTTSSSCSGRKNKFIWETRAGCGSPAGWTPARWFVGQL